MTLYEQILSLPLFQGLSHDDLSNIVAHTKFDFTKVDAGSVIIRENSPCTHLQFLLNGTAVVRSHADDNSYHVEEDISAPSMFQIERLFGLRQYYSHDVIALTDCSLLILTKEEIMKLSDQMLIFRINLFNRLATDSQKLSGALWKRKPANIEDKLLNFFVTHVAYPAGHKAFYITMQTLADEISNSRLNVSQLLNRLNQKGLIALSRGKIDIPHLEKLLQLKDNP